jgi:hypothetical protein
MQQNQAWLLLSECEFYATTMTVVLMCKTITQGCLVMLCTNAKMSEFAVEALAQT